MTRPTDEQVEARLVVYVCPECGNQSFTRTSCGFVVGHETPVEMEPVEYVRASGTGPSREALESELREVLIEATREIPHGSEGYVGWSAVLAERLADKVLALGSGEGERLREALERIAEVPDTATAAIPGDIARAALRRGE